MGKEFRYFQIQNFRKSEDTKSSSSEMTTLSLQSNNTWSSHCQHLVLVHTSQFVVFQVLQDMFRSCTCLFRTLRPPIKESLRRSFKRQTVEERVKSEKGNLEVSDLWKPVLFSATFTGFTFAACSIWQYESYVKNHSFVYMKNLKEEFNRFNQVKRIHYRNEVRILSDWIIKQFLTQSTRNRPKFLPQNSCHKVLATKLSLIESSFVPKYLPGSKMVAFIVGNRTTCIWNCFHQYLGIWCLENTISCTYHA